jgi:hypothetical protein
VHISIGSKASEFDVIKLTEIQKVLAEHPNIEVVGESEDGFESVRNPGTPPLITTQAELSPIGRIATKETLEQHPDFLGEWDK